MRVIETFVTSVPRSHICDNAKFFVQDWGDGLMCQYSKKPVPGDFYWESNGYLSEFELSVKDIASDAAETVVTREELMRAYDLVEQGYTLWFGEGLPVEHRTLVDVVLRNHHVSQDIQAGGCSWSSFGWNSDIIAYRISQCDREVVNEGEKYDSQKPRFSLVPNKALTDVIDVLEFGAQKYGADNWRKVDNAQERYFNAAMRHLLAWRKGELSDDESGLPHLAHAATCLMFMIEGNEK